MQIIASRTIRKLFTGCLNARMECYPAFPGLERNYLRAQIARISGSTLISPSGFYQTSGNDEEEEDEGINDETGTLMENPEFEPLTLDELTDPSLESWVHHSGYVLRQGRLMWWDPRTAKTSGSPLSDGDSGQDEDDGEDVGEEDEIEPEIGPELLTAIAEDDPVGGQPGWAVCKSSSSMPEHAYAVVRSIRWPGAYAIASGRYFSNIYIGSGLRWCDEAFSPQRNPVALLEFPSGPEIAEADDPSVEQEEALQRAQEERARKLEAEHEEAEEGLSEEEEQEESDQD